MSPQRGPELVLSTQPFVRQERETPAIMREVFYAAAAVLVFATIHFGISALLEVAAATLGAVGAEWAFTRREARSPLRDWSAALTGILLGLTLPPGMPLWMAFLGGVAGIGLGKLIWGGLGQNVFNPALVGRAFLQSAFPTTITTWAAPAGDHFWHIVPGQLAAPLMSAGPDIVSSATPLGLQKFEHTATAVGHLFLGQTAGSLGETNAALLLCLGLILALRKTFDWRLPASTLLGAFVFSGILWLTDTAAYPTPWAMLLSGGLLFGAVFMVTDPVTTPITPKGAWIFGIGVGFLVVLIRVFGGLPEGVMYAILLMNGATPHINRFTQPKPFGAQGRA